MTDRSDTLPIVTDAPKKPDLPAIKFDSRRDYTLVREAIMHRAADVKKLGTKASDEGYPREAAAMTADADRLVLALAPKFAAQAELPLATEEELAAAIVNVIRPTVVRNVKPATKELDHEAILLRYLGERIAAFAAAVAEAGFRAGVAYREATPEVIAIGVIDALRVRPGVD